MFQVVVTAKTLIKQMIVEELLLSIPDDPGSNPGRIHFYWEDGIKKMNFLMSIYENFLGLIL